MKAPRITLHMVSSLDGMAAKKDNSVGWFDTSDNFEEGAAMEDPGGFLQTVDCFVMGARTYEHAVALSADYGWPYGDKPTYVMTHRSQPPFRPQVECFAGSLQALVERLQQLNYERIWVVGGPTLLRDFMRERLADEIRMYILPILLGDGIPFFQPTELEQKLRVKNIKGFTNGMAELHYEFIK